MYGRLPLPFKVVALAADNQNATVLSSKGRLWELRGLARWLSGDENSNFRGVRHEHRVFGTGEEWRVTAPPPSGFPSELVSRLTSAEQYAKPKPESEAMEAEARRVVQLFAATRPCCPYLGGCVTADGRMHVWLRTHVIAHSQQCRISGRWAKRRGYHQVRFGPASPAWENGEHVVHTLPEIPVEGGRAVITALMGDSFIVALVGGEVWAVGVFVAVNVKFSSWKKVCHRNEVS